MKFFRGNCHSTQLTLPIVAFPEGWASDKKGESDETRLSLILWCG